LSGVFLLIILGGGGKPYLTPESEVAESSNNFAVCGETKVYCT